MNSLWVWTATDKARTGLSTCCTSVCDPAMSDTTGPRGLSLANYRIIEVHVPQPLHGCHARALSPAPRAHPTQTMCILSLFGCPLPIAAGRASGKPLPWPPARTARGALPGSQCGEVSLSSASPALPPGRSCGLLFLILFHVTCFKLRPI